MSWEDPGAGRDAGGMREKALLLDVIADGERRGHAGLLNGARAGQVAPRKGPWTDLGPRK